MLKRRYVYSVEDASLQKQRQVVISLLMGVVLCSVFFDNS